MVAAGGVKSWLALILRGCLAIAWTALLCLLLLQPEADPLLDLGIPDGENTLARELAFAAVHVIAFAMTCALWAWALAARFCLQGSIVVAVCISLALGVFTEVAQGFTLDRHASWLDLGANIAGTLIAARLISNRRIVGATNLVARSQSVSS